MKVNNQRCSLYYSFRISVDLIFFKIDKLRASIFFAEIVYCESGEATSLPILRSVFVLLFRDLKMS